MYGKNPHKAPPSAVISTIEISGEPLSEKIIKSDKQAIKDIPVDNPSNPSIKFIALVIPTIQTTVNPAKTFIGDTGSNFLGYCLSIISILGIAKTYTAIVIVAPLMVLALPIFDTLSSIIRRVIAGKSLKAIIQPDANHLHHKMLKKGFTQKQAVLIMYGLSATFGMFAIILMDSGIWKALSFALIMVVIVAMGYKEFFKQRLLATETTEDHEEFVEEKEEPRIRRIK